VKFVLKLKLMKKKLVVLTGAGISAERDQNFQR
jgi:NAD-dependent SIR2 family protein deacetylase